MSNIFSDKRKLFGTILGLIMFALTIVSITYAYYSWRSSNTIVTFNIQDNVFYCETDVPSSVNTDSSNALSPVNNYRNGIHQAFIVKNIGRQDTTFSLTMNITNISSDVIKDSTFKYKLVYDPTGGSIDCTQADATDDGSGNTCRNVTNGTGDFSNIQIGMNTLIQSISLPNNSKYKYYFFMYLDGQGGQTPSGIQSASMTSTLGVCDIYSPLYVGTCDSVSPNCLKLTSGHTYGTATACSNPNGSAIGLPNATKANRVVSYNSNASGVSNPDSQTLTYSFSGWYKQSNFSGSVVNNNTAVDVITNGVLHIENTPLYAKCVPNSPSSGSITLPNISRPGFTLDGWYTQASGGTKVGNGGATYTPTNSITLYAHWNPNSVTVNVKKDNGIYNSSGMKIVLSTDKDTNTNTFDGTATNSITFTSNGTKNVVAGTKYYIWVGKDSNHKLDMVYTGVFFTATAGSNSQNVNYYTLILRSNHVGSMGVNGTGVNDAGSVIVASNWPHNITSAADTGYSFASWSKTAGGGTVTFGDASQASTTANVTVNSATITANANSNVYTITLNNQNATTAGTSAIYEKYNAGYYLESAATNQMTTSANPITKPARTGYTFLGYYTTAEGGTQYIDANGNLTSSANITNFTSNGNLWAHWSKAVSTLTNTTNPTSYLYDGTAKTPSPVVKDGSTTLTNNTDYTFAVSNNTNVGTATGTITGKNVFNSTTKAFYTGTATVSFTITNVTLTFVKGTCDTISGSTTLYTRKNATAVYTGLLDSTTGTIPTASKTGYTFQGWYSGSSGGSKVLNANGTFSGTAVSGYTTTNAWVATTNQTLHAECVPDVYTVTLNNQNATTAGTSAIYEKYNTGYYLDSTATNQMTTSANPITKPVRTGYNFDGYYDNANGGTKFIQGENDTNSGYIVNGASTTKFSSNGNLWAHWLKSVSSLTSSISPTSYIYDGTAKTPTPTVKDGSTTLANNTDYTFAASNNTNVGNASATITGKNTFNSTTKAYYTGTKTINYAITNATLTFTKGTCDTISGSTTLYTRKNATAVYTGLQNSTAGTIPTASKVGYNFLGWYSGSSGGSKVLNSNGSFSGTAVSGYTTTNAWDTTTNQTLHAECAVSTYTLTYDCQTNGGTTANSTQSYNYGASVDLTKTCSKTGWEHIGWAETSSATSGLNSYNMPASDKTLYAIYKKSVTATFTIQDSNAATQSGGSLTCNMFNNDTSCGITAPTLAAKSGYTVVGWKLNGKQTDTTSNLASAGTTTISSNVTYKSITFNKTAFTATTKPGPSGPTGTAKTVSCNRYNGLASCSVNTPTNPYTWSGWTWQAWAVTTGTTTTATTGTAANTSITLTANTNLVAIWKNTSQYTATFTIQDPNAATQSGGTTSCYRYNGNSSCNITAPTLTAKSGYKVVGWKLNGTQEDKNSDLGSGASTSISSNVTYKSITYNDAAFTATPQKNISGATGSPSAVSCNRYNGATSCTVAVPASNSYTYSGFSIISWKKTNDTTTTTSTATSGDANPGGNITLTANTNIVAIWKSSSQFTATPQKNISDATGSPSAVSCYRYNGESSCTVAAPASNSYTYSDFSIISWKKTNDTTTTTSTATSGDANPGSNLTLTANTNIVAIWKSSSQFTATYYYNSNTTCDELTVSTTTKSCWRYNGESNCMVDVPSVVKSSKSKHNVKYRGIAHQLSTMNSDANILSLSISRDTNLYAVYSQELTIYYPNTSDGVSSQNNRLYRNEFFTNVTSGSEAMGIVTATAPNSESQATSITLSNLRGTLLGITPTVNTSTGYMAVNNSNIKNSCSYTTYYAVTNYTADNATIYYNSNTTAGEFTPSTATVSGWSNRYCVDTSTQGTHGSTINLSSVPSSVTNSVGKWNTPYHGISSSVNSMNLASSMTVGGSYYAVYGAGETTGGTGAVNSNVDEYYNSSINVSNFSYTGSAQTFTAVSDGIYKVELWGAQGGPGASDAVANYGKGGYSSGNIRLSQNEKLYVYVGQRGPTNASVTNVGGWNGGGYSGNHSSANSYGGGGATDVRLVLANASDLTVWNEATSLRSRIMVAGGGGGGSNNTAYIHQAGVGGGLIAIDGIGSYNSTDSGGGTQTGPGTASTGKQGSFGYAVQTNVAGFGGGGGGGYWGGSTGHGKPGGGGSSYISGYEGSVAVASASSSAAKSGCANGTTDVTCSYHYSGKIFTDAAMLTGFDYMPTHDGISDMWGNEGNGYAKITKIASIRPLYRNEYFTSATGMNTVLSTTTSGTTNITTSAGTGNSTWYGYGTNDVPDLISNTYEYTGNVQTFTASKSANYRVQLSGAQGGNGAGGGYTSGNIFLNQSDKLYVYVGGEGPTNASYTNVGGWNGGGYSGNNNGAYSYGGGGATDVRLVKASETATVWNEPTSLRSRIMVAAGGGGSTNNTSFTHNPGFGGGLTGGTGTGSYTSGTVSGGGTQTGPGIAYSDAHKGLFGSGPQSNPAGWGGGGGGGYWGGSTGYGRPGGGGSSYISGYVGSVAVASEDSSLPKNGCTDGTTDVTCSYHYSKKVFSDANMVTCDDGSCLTGSNPLIGFNGEAVITQLDNNVRIRTYSTVSTAAQSTSRTLYSIYQMSVNYQKGTHVTEIGDTSGNCLMNYDDSYCSVGAPSITPDYGYDENGWSTIQNDSNYGVAPTNGIKLTTNNNTYYGNATNTAVDVTYISGYNHMTGLDDIGVTSPIGGVGDTTNRMSYSITDGVVTVTGKDQYGYGMTTGRVYLEAGHTYRFSCDTDGVWGQAANTGYVYAHLMLNGSAQSGSTWYGMASPNNYIFTATVTGEYWLRLAVSKANETHTFSDIDIQEIYGIQHAHYGDNYQVPSSNPARSGHTFIEWHDWDDILVNNDKTITLAEDHDVIAQWGKNPVITYSSGNILTGLDDCETTEATAGGQSLNYSISEGMVTATNTGLRVDGYGYTTGRVFLEANHTYRFNAETDGTWSTTENSGQVEAYLMFNGLVTFNVCGSANFCHMDSNENFEFTPLLSGEYWLRLDVNENGGSYHFWNISVEEIIDEIATSYGGNYVLPSSNPTRYGHQFDHWYSLECSGGEDTSITSSTSLCSNDDHTVYVKWNKTYHVYLQGIGGLTATRTYKFDGYYNKDNGHLDNTLVGNSIYVWDNMNQDSTTSNDARVMSGTWGDDYLQLNGTTGGVNLNHGYGNKASQSAFTIESIVTLEGYPGSGNESWILGDIESGGVGLGIDGAGRVKFQYWNGSGWQIVYGPSLILKKKYHLIGTFNAGVSKIYVDGRLVVQQTMSGANIIHPATTNGATNMWVGCNPGPSGCQSAYFNGKIYSVSYYASAISADTISAAGFDLEQNDTYSSLPTPSRTGYTFGGWYDSTDFTNQVTSSSVFNGNEDVTLYAKWEANLNTTFYDDEYNVPISITNGSSGGVTFSWDSSKHYLMLNGTQTANTILGYVNNIFSTNDQWDLVVRYVSGSASDNGTNNGVIVDVATSSGTIGGSSGLSTRNAIGVQYPRLGTNTATLTVSQLAATNGAKFALWLWKNGSYSVTFKNYVIQIDIVKSKTVYYNGTSWNDLARKKNGTVSNGTFVAPNGNNAGYLQFNGTSTWANLGQLNMTKFTLEADVVVDALPASGNSSIVANYQVGGYGLFVNASGKPCFAVRNNNNSYDYAYGTTTITTGTRYKIAGTFDGSNLRIFVNGNLETTVALTGTFVATTNSTVMAIGADPDGSSATGEYLNGKIYSVKISNKALAQSALGTNIVDSSTVRYYKVDADKTHYTVLPEISSDNYNLPSGANSVRGNFDAWYTATTNSSNMVSAITKVPYNYDHAVFASYIGNAVQITYHMNGGEWAGSSNGSLGHSGDLITFYGGARTYASYEYGSTINLPDYNYNGYINISHPQGKAAKDNLQWCTNADGTGTCYNQATDYSTNEFCNAAQSNCQVDLYVNWINVNCAAAGSPTTFAGKSWYTMSNNDTTCELALNSQSNITGTYNEANSKLSSEYFADNSVLKAANDAGIINTFDSNSGLTTQGMSGSYIYWNNSGKVYHSSTYNNYTCGSALSYYYSMSNNGTIARESRIWSRSNSPISAGVIDVTNTASSKTFSYRTSASGTSTNYVAPAASEHVPTSGSSTKITVRYDSLHPCGSNGSYNCGTYNPMGTISAKTSIVYYVCGGSYQGKKSVTLKPYSTSKYHYKNHITGTENNYSFSDVWDGGFAGRYFDMAGTASNSGTSDARIYRFDLASNGCSKKTYYTCSSASTTENIHYRLHITVIK